MPTRRKKPVAQPFEVPHPPARVWGPTVLYDYSGEAALQYRGEDGQGHVQVTFEGFDALRVCRGGALPYRAVRSRATPDTRVYLVDSSHWLQERLAYQALHAPGREASGYEHYLFAFHAQHVEVLAQGVWFESSRRRFTPGAPRARHPLAVLPPSDATGRFTVAGLTCQVRTNPLPLDEVLRLARYCTQPLFHLVLGDTVWMRLDVRARRGEVRSLWRNAVGTPLASLPGAVSLARVKRLAAPLLRERARRRR